MTHKLIKSFQYGFVVLAVLALVYIFSVNSIARASAPSGMATLVATSSNPTISTTAVTLFATSTSCTARVVTTVASPIMLTFSDYANQTPTGVYGHLQAASTTVVYDSGQYGCGLFKAYGFTSSAITVSELQGFK